MSQFDNYGDGHIRRALPGITPGVRVLLIANLVGFVITTMFFFSKSEDVLDGFVGLSFDNMWSGFGLGLLRTVTYQFFHGGAWHLIGNMICLYFFGGLAEGRPSMGYGGSHHWLGFRGVIRLYLVGGVVAGLIYAAAGALAGQGKIPVIGASGSVYCLMVYAAAINRGLIVHFIFFSIEIRYLVGALVFLGLYAQAAEWFLGVGSDGVADSAHLGGAVWGYIAYKMAQKGASFPDPLAWLRRRRDVAKFRSAQDRQETLDRILDKVKSQGMSALTGAERRFLEKASKDARK